MFPSVNYLKDLALYSKLTKDLIVFVPQIYKKDVNYYSIFYSFTKVLDNIRYRSIEEASSGKKNFRIMLFDNCAFTFFNDNKTVSSETTKEILHKKINNIILKKSEMIVSILDRFGYNVVLDIIDDEYNICSKKIFIRFNLED